MSVKITWDGKKAPVMFTCESPYIPCMQIGGASTRNSEKVGLSCKLFNGNCLGVMRDLLSEYKGKVDLIYIDPPFNSETTYKRKIYLHGNSKKEFCYDPQFSDHWFGIDNYLQFMYERLILMRELLSETGTLYLHCDWRCDSYLRMILDEIFSDKYTPELNPQNVIAWCYKSGGASDRCFSKKHDTILVYNKTKNYTFNISKQKSYMMPCSGKNPAQVYYQDEKGTYTLVNLKDYWTDIGIIATSAHERTNYPTQKPEALIERIIRASSNEGDLVLDAFCGSGTTAVVSKKLSRNFIGIDSNARAIETTIERIISENCLKKEKNIFYSSEQKEFSLSVFKNKDNTSIAQKKELKIDIKDGSLRILSFKPEYALEKFSEANIKLNDWRQTIEAVYIDWNYDGNIFNPTVFDFPEKKEFAGCNYYVPSNSGSIMVKVVDVFQNGYVAILKLKKE